MGKWENIGKPIGKPIVMFVGEEYPLVNSHITMERSTIFNG